MGESSVYVIESVNNNNNNNINNTTVGKRDDDDEKEQDLKYLDKGWSNVILFSSFCTCCIIGANNYGTGIIHKILLERYNESVALTSWSGSLQLALMCLSGEIKFPCSSAGQAAHLLTL
jgi:hypothetical protein